jgi:serine phosphatase RsbU (regulator of sigma subunit)
VRAFLFVVLGIGSVLPVTLLGFQQAERWTRSEVEAADRQALAAARSAADQVSWAMMSYVHTSESFAAQVALLAEPTRSALMPLLDTHVAHHPEFLGAYVADARGMSRLHVFANREFADGGHDYGDRDYYQEILRTGKTAISHVQIGRVTKLLSVNVASPIFGASHKLTGITCSPIDLRSITEQAKTTVQGMVGGRLVLVDGEGQEIADSRDNSAIAPVNVALRPLFAELESQRGELRQGLDELDVPVRAAAVGLGAPVARWRIVVLTPQLIVDAHARQTRNQTVLLSLALVLAALVLSAWLSGWLARPLRALAATAETVQRDEHAPLPSVVAGAPREIAQLTQAIAAMIARLRAHADNLEALVHARTEQLSQSNSELSHALSTIRDNERRIYDDIEKARLFQVRMLPVVPTLAGLELAVLYAPLERVSGDIYDLTPMAANRLRLFLADATGHGVQAAMRTILLKTAYDRLRPLHADPAQLLEALNAYLVDEFPEGELHCTASCIDLVVHADAVEVLYASGGNPPLFVLTPGQPVREVYAGGPLLGAERLPWPEPDRFRLEPGELLLVCSDGLSEQTNSEHTRFDGQLATFRRGPAGAAATISSLKQHFDAFRGSTEVTDDVTVIAVRVPLEASPTPLVTPP